MKIIEIDKNTRQCLPSNITIGYLEENYTEKLQFVIPEEYRTYGRKALFQTMSGETFSTLFDNITDDTVTLTSGITKYKELDLTIEFFKTDNEKQIIAKSSMLHITISDSVLDTDTSPEDPEINIINDLIDKVNTSIKEVDNLNISTERIDNGVNIKVIGKDGTETITELKDGEKGEKGDKGEPGQDGKPGAVKMEVVESLPSIGEIGTIYLLTKENPTENNMYDEYVYTSKGWEYIGGTGSVDLSNYYTKKDVDTELNTKQNKLIPGDGIDITTDNTINVTDVLFTNNTTPYTPTNDYNPSTKKYVDDAINNIQISDTTYIINTSTSAEEKITIMQEVYDKYISGTMANLTYIDTSGNVFSLFDVDKFETHIDFFMINGGTATTKYAVGYYAYDRYRINCAYNNNTITSVDIEELSDTYMLADNSEILGINNKTEYTPTSDYQPSTKKYVDDTIKNIDIPSADLSNYYNKNEINEMMNNKANKATTLSGYNITDAYTKTEVDSVITTAITGALEGSY